MIGQNMLQIQNAETYLSNVNLKHEEIYKKKKAYILCM